MTGAEQADIVIIGSGPAAVSAALPLLEAGHSILMLEAGEAALGAGLPDPWIDFRRQRDDQWSQLVRDADGLASGSQRSAKFSVPWFRDLAERSGDQLDVGLDGFAGTPVAAVGGLSVAWGAGAALFDAADLKDWPIESSDLSDDYRSVAERMGLSGAWPDWAGSPPRGVGPHPGLHPNARLLLGRNARAKRRGLHVFEALQAVLTDPADVDRPGRSRCDLQGGCLYGCSRQAIWSAAHEIANLRRFRGFELRPSVFVQRVQREGGYWRIDARDRSGDIRIDARRVVMAAGAIGTARLVMPLRGDAMGATRLLSSPAAAFALLFPWRIGSAWQERFFGLSQLHFRQDFADEYVSGALFAGEGLPLNAFASLLPFRARAGLRMMSDLTPACLFGNMFFDGRHSQHEIRLEDQSGVSVSGGHGAGLASALSAVAGRARSAFLSMGAILLPLTPRLASPGSDLHFAGSVPMRSRPGIGDTDRFGVMPGLEDLILVDGSVLSTLPAKSHTLTIMANARRVARHWARQWSAAAPPVTTVS